MEYTTHFELHSQTTRLFEDASQCDSDWIKYGILTLFDALFQGTFTQAANESASLNYNSPRRFQI
jgi:hypothetical protein